MERRLIQVGKTFVTISLLEIVDNDKLTFESFSHLKRIIFSKTARRGATKDKSAGIVTWRKLESIREMKRLWDLCPLDLKSVQAFPSSTFWQFSQVSK